MIVSIYLLYLDEQGPRYVKKISEMCEKHGPYSCIPGFLIENEILSKNDKLLSEN